MDVVSWDNYPSLDTPISFTAMSHALMRGLKSGKPFMLMEQTPSQQNWQPYNSLKRPGVMRLWSYQAVAHGADTVMFFQLRRSIGACEKYHGAVIEHVGHEHTRVFRECATLGSELVQLGDALLDARHQSQVAIVFDWENRWALDLTSGPTIALKYVDQVHSYYRAFYEANIQTDMISVEEQFEKYKIVVAPVMYMIKPGFAEKVEKFVESGGTFITTFFSGIVDEHDIVTIGGYPGKLRKVLGIWAEEIDALLPTQTNQIVMNQSFGKLEGSYSCSILCDLIHSEGAEVLATYGSDFYKGMPALTRHSYGKGKAYYVATSPEQHFLNMLVQSISQESSIQPLLAPATNVEVTERVKDGQAFLFILNHGDVSASIELGDVKGTDLITGNKLEGSCELLSKEVIILRKEQ